jgi:hypothetical protein
VTLRRKPSLFIGSSVEGLDVAYALQESLEFDAEPTVWPQGIFRPTSSTLASLLAVAHQTDFAAFVFTPDDIRIMRDEEGKTPRDNVVFELGLMIGACGVDRCVFLMPGDAKLALPSDLLGIAPLTYVSNRRDGNLLAALGPAANKIRRLMQQIGAVSVSEVPAPPPPAQDPIETAADYVRQWNEGDLLQARQVLRRGIPLHPVEDETGEATLAMRRLFAFLESMADGVLSGRLSEADARLEFAAPLHAFWRHAYTFLAPLNQADEWWDPLPKSAELDRRWQGASK